jgi:hypothetical protein
MQSRAEGSEDVRAFLGASQDRPRTARIRPPIIWLLFPHSCDHSEPGRELKVKSPREQVPSVRLDICQTGIWGVISTPTSQPGNLSVP